MFEMPKISFKVLSKDSKTNTAVFEFSPLLRGFGNTIGSSLRRTLYSSSKGAAITQVRLEGVSHQFSTIAGAKDDVLEILLNLKMVKIKKEIDGPIELSLESTGPGDVTAGDIESAAGIEIVNKNLVITSLANKKASLKAKLTIEDGIGYKEVEESGSGALGTILLDADFSPIISVSVQVEETRVGRDANYDKLILTVKTDGTIDTEAAIREAAKMLKEFYFRIQTGEDYTEEEELAMEAAQAESADEASVSADEVLLEELHLPTRTVNALRKSGIKTLGDLAGKNEDDLLRVRNLGEKSIKQILGLLEKEGLK